MKSRIGIALIVVALALVGLRALYLFGDPLVVDGGLVAASFIGILGVSLWATDD